ncbi:MAG: hypothetical protein A2126_00685 [Candidatus Woykebacteria bacterium GWB1_45_5]|uniref:Uncharacterized protein n=2 Tax=Candidatus Woykeibacteriota TaxID=1817899 RepID=A0A1G1W2L0_9BACT|nr:MAG: hypothetical protein A2113_00965 [Candidatus Woykebacteria bacterium GWA1_44_8]OGY24235.1 MAG: hypothetical protein A2126_00685 [Candidatus Woykebacteria bacterium GWB1_45_5]
MKLSWKEILLIFVLAVLAVGLSLIYGRMEGCPKVNCPPEEICPLIFCVATFVRGWPLPFYQQGWDFNEPIWLGFYSPIPIVVDLLFYFVIFLIGWMVLKFIYKRVKS